MDTIEGFSKVEVHVQSSLPFCGLFNDVLQGKNVVNANSSLLENFCCNIWVCFENLYI